MYSTGHSSYNINDCIFTNNNAGRGGVIETNDDSSININGCISTNNSARTGGVIACSIDH